MVWARTVALVTRSNFRFLNSLYNGSFSRAKHHCSLVWSNCLTASSVSVRRYLSILLLSSTKNDDHVLT
ncbi:hypothetical protein O9992_02680 [Vibrio lentus]|nr:hypothetical protein [Vibrio lentus]